MTFWTELKSYSRKTIKWEVHVAQQIPLSRPSSPYPDNEPTRSLDQLEPETEDDMDMRDFSEKAR